jgi:CDP-4-dehydro-6-deoxyglucose reductase, E1
MTQLSEHQATERQLRQAALDAASNYHRFCAETRPPFAPGDSPVSVTGKQVGDAELRCLVDASLDLWLTSGRYADVFEARLAQWLGLRRVLLVNSGSSANLLALTALTSPQLGDRRLQPGDEVITVAAGFPTTINPIFQNSLVPVFVDICPDTGNVDVDMLEAAWTPRTRCVMVAHTLGNPFDLQAVQAFTEKHDLWLIEDNCDALGSLYDGRKTGTFGHLATLSFYPAHHLTMGEGGAVLTNDLRLAKIVESLRDWGRDCWCPPGHDNTCGKRFGWQLGDLPAGYDHKYTYSHVGYNLKLTDMQAAVGVAQLDRLDHFCAVRRHNFDYLKNRLAPLSEWLVLPKATPNADPSWFGFLLQVRPDSPVSRSAIIEYLESRRIGTRLLFGGNLVRQPAYRDRHFRMIGNLPYTEAVMHHAFWVGVWPGLSEAHLDWIVAALFEIFGRKDA